MGPGGAPEVILVRFWRYFGGNLGKIFDGFFDVSYVVRVLAPSCFRVRVGKDFIKNST